QDGGVVDEDVEPAELLLDLPRRRGDALRPGLVEGQEVDVEPLVPQPAGRFLAPVLIAGAEQDRDVLPGEPPGNLEADTFVRTGEEGNFPGLQERLLCLP